MTKESGGKGWSRMEVVMKGMVKKELGTMASGEEGNRSEDRRRREVVPMGRGEEGKD